MPIRTRRGIHLRPTALSPARGSCSGHATRPARVPTPSASRLVGGWWIGQECRREGNEGGGKCEEEAGAARCRKVPLGLKNCSIPSKKRPGDVLASSWRENQPIPQQTCRSLGARGRVVRSRRERGGRRRAQGVQLDDRLRRFRTGGERTRLILFFGRSRFLVSWSSLGEFSTFCVVDPLAPQPSLSVGECEVSSGSFRSFRVQRLRNDDFCSVSALTCRTKQLDMRVEKRGKQGSIGSPPFSFIGAQRAR